MGPPPDVGIHGHDFHTRPGPAHLAELDQVVGYTKGPIDGNGESQPLTPPAPGEDGRVHADDFPMGVHQRASGVPWVDGGVGLDHPKVEALILAGGDDVPAHRAHHTCRDRGLGVG